MIIDSHINVTFGNMLSEIHLPELYRIKRHFQNDCIQHIEEHTLKEMTAFLNNQNVSGKSVAITIGSRGITGYTEIIRSVIAAFRTAGADPYLITSMGSHAGATEEGQRAMAKHLGIDPEQLGIELRSSMSATQIGALSDGTPVYCANDALAADAVFLINKVKPHADFKGEHESGLLKMSVIGLGKHLGCSQIHKLGFARFAEVIPAAAKVVFDKVNIIGGLGIVENSYDKPAIIKAVPKDLLFQTDAELLIEAKNNIARLPANSLDVLVIDEVGKEVSGEGMDPNVTGRPGSNLMSGFDFIHIGSIIVRGVTNGSEGNGVGIGMADISTIRAAKQLNLGLMYTNSITAGILGPSRLPVFLNSDVEALKTAIRVSAGDHLDSPEICWIKNTVKLEDMIVSEAFMKKIVNTPGISVEGIYRPVFDEADYLVSPFLTNGGIK